MSCQLFFFGTSWVSLLPLSWLRRLFVWELRNSVCDFHRGLFNKYLRFIVLHCKLWPAFVFILIHILAKLINRLEWRCCRFHVRHLLLCVSVCCVLVDLTSFCSLFFFLFCRRQCFLVQLISFEFVLSLLVPRVPWKKPCDECFRLESFRCCDSLVNLARACRTWTWEEEPLRAESSWKIGSYGNSDVVVSKRGWGHPAAVAWTEKRRFARRWRRGTTWFFTCGDSNVKSSVSERGLKLSQALRLVLQSDLSDHPLTLSEKSRHYLFIDTEISPVTRQDL